MPDDPLLLISAYADGELAGDDVRRAEDLLAASPEARAFLDDINTLRRSFRYQEAGDQPDVVPAVLAGLPTRHGAPVWLSIAAVFLVGVVAGAAFVGFTRDRGQPPAAASIADRVLEAQHDIGTLSATLAVREIGWHPDVPERTYTGSIRYEAPERLAVVFEDGTVYPATGPWVPNDTVLVVDDDVSWSSGPAGCPMEAQPSCTPSSPRTLVTTGRGPFPDAAPAPLDLVVPVVSLAGSSTLEVIGSQTMGGVPAVGVRVTAAQTAPLTAGLLASGNWRLVHPTDVVELWLAEATLTPVAMTIQASADPDRALWAVRHGYTDVPGDAVFEFRWSDLAVNDGPIGPLPDRPDDTIVDAGFVDGDVVPIGVDHLPSGLTFHRSGSAGSVKTMAWSDGRAWLRVSWTEEWPGGRLFGDLDIPVQRIDASGGVVYVGDGGRRVAVHGSNTDVVVTGSLSPEALLAVALGIDVAGIPVPPTWPEAGASTIGAAEAALDGRLLIVDEDRYGSPAIDVSAGVVTMSHTGPGARAFVVIESIGELPPPTTGDVIGVAVRRSSGRWTPDAGTLEWVEGGLVVTVRSATLSRSELLDIAATMSRR